MLLGGAHDSRAGPPAGTRPRRAVRGSSGPLCRAWGQPFQGLPPNPMDASMVARAPARAVDPDSSRRARTRGLMDTSHLLILRNPCTICNHRPQPNCLPNLRLQTAPS